MSALDVSRHLYRFFPAHMNREVGVGAGSVAEVLRAINEWCMGLPITCLMSMAHCIGMSVPVSLQDRKREEIALGPCP
jgi:hypothetical protein